MSRFRQDLGALLLLKRLPAKTPTASAPPGVTASRTTTAPTKQGLEAKPETAASPPTKTPAEKNLDSELETAASLLSMSTIRTGSVRPLYASAFVTLWEESLREIPQLVAPGIRDGTELEQLLSRPGGLVFTASDRRTAEQQAFAVVWPSLLRDAVSVLLLAEGHRESNEVASLLVAQGIFDYCRSNRLVAAFGVSTQSATSVSAKLRLVIKTRGLLPEPTHVRSDFDLDFVSPELLAPDLAPRVERDPRTADQS